MLGKFDTKMDSNNKITELSLGKKPNIVRRLYNWMLKWADTPWGGWALFLFAVAESSFFPIPPDILLIALCFGAVTKSFKYALICTVGSVLGAIIGFGIGYGLWDIAQDWFIPAIFSQEAFDAIGLQYEKWNFWVVFTAGFTPIPYKLITVSAGVFLEASSIWMFILASVISRGMRFFLVAFLIWKFGKPIKKFIDKYFNLCAIAFTVLLIGSFLIIKYLL